MQTDAEKTETPPSLDAHSEKKHTDNPHDYENDFCKVAAWKTLLCGF